MEITENKIVRNAQSLNGDIILKNISFRYGSRKLILKNINLNIKKGQRVAIVGERGSGKTTIAKLLMRFYEFESGEIIINSNSIAENLLYVNPDVTYKEMIYVCKEVGMDEFIKDLPLGYDSVLDENGNNLSSGQKQRLSIARALLKRPEILIMDESTSNLDTLTEKIVEKTIKNMGDNVAVIIIAHRLTTVMHCDNTFVLASGEIIEYGDNNYLMQCNGYYNSLWCANHSLNNYNDTTCSSI